jgi:hypothetical protein
MCQHSFLKKIGEEIKYRSRTPYKLIKIFKCNNCGAKVEKLVKLKERTKQIDLNSKEVI